MVGWAHKQNKPINKIPKCPFARLLSILSFTEIQIACTLVCTTVIVYYFVQQCFIYLQNSFIYKIRRVRQGLLQRIDSTNGAPLKNRRKKNHTHTHAQHTEKADVTKSNGVYKWARLMAFYTDWFERLRIDIGVVNVWCELKIVFKKVFFKWVVWSMNVTCLTGENVPHSRGSWIVAILECHCVVFSYL